MSKICQKQLAKSTSSSIILLHSPCLIERCCLHTFRLRVVFLLVTGSMFVGRARGSRVDLWLGCSSRRWYCWDFEGAELGWCGRRSVISRYALGLLLTQDASHRQDYCIFRIGNPELNLHLPFFRHFEPWFLHILGEMHALGYCKYIYSVFFCTMKRTYVSNKPILITQDFEHSFQKSSS